MTTSSAPELSSLEPPKPIEIKVSSICSVPIAYSYSGPSKVRSSTTTDASMSGDSLSSTGVGKRLFV